MSRSIISILSVACCLLVVAPLHAQTDHFRAHVAPVLQRRCLSCHNDTEHKGDLSLQTAAGLMNEGYVEAGDSAASHLIEVITPKSGKAEMPKKADPLSAAEIQAIAKWIDDGAQWPDGFVLAEPRVTDFDWWSFKPVTRPDVPDVDGSESNWVRTPIDAFILQKLNEKGLVHADEADRRTLIRRLTYDLIGLPPTPDDVAAFVVNENPKAYENLVDRLLESKHYGERWARHWLDVVKYADTCGYDKDKLRPNAWPYRDYVIRSFNDDKPYSRFVQEQVAGDVLFPGEADGILGLGFIAAGPWDFIGHVEVPESKIDGKVARNLDRDDMVSNTLNTFCSVTVQCARCHNHKFDPITQEHYYGLQSIFAAVDRADRTYDLDPHIEKQRHELNKQLAAKKAELHIVTKEMVDDGGPRFLELNDRIAALQKQLTVKKAPEFGYHSAIASNSTTEKWVEIELRESTELSRIVLRACHDEFGNIGAGFGFPVRFKIEIAADNEWITVSDQTKSDYPNPQLAAVEIGDLAARARRVRVTATHLALRSNDYIFALAELQVFDASGNNVALHAGVKSLDSIEAPVRWGKKNLTDGLWPKSGDQKLADQLAQVMREQAVILARIQTPGRVKRRDACREAITQIEGNLAALPKGQMVYAAATHFAPQGNFQPTNGNLRPVHVLHRGNIQQPLHPAVPRVLPFDNENAGQLRPDANEAERRAQLARWLTDGEHPLVWRSIVNRVWQYHFGQGLVATSNDFGRMGALPTHPELLDWLAMQFRDNGQSMKQLHRLIVTSSVYRQSSRRNDANAAIDGSNRFLWRMKRRRLEAEEIRDSILEVSGSLDLKMGGPGFYLFALEKTDHSPHYEYYKFDPTDPQSHRRSIYRFIVRSQPDPWMTTLDCADSSQSTPKRDETLTSLQALSLLNNRFNLVMAERFAARLHQEEKDLSGQIDRAMLLVAQRLPEESERSQFESYAKTHGLPNLCRILFNLSEFVYLD